jgi:hypothetical protein
LLDDMPCFSVSRLVTTYYTYPEPTPLRHTTAAGPVATPWVITALAPLREHLATWPTVLPSEVGDPIRPLKIGVREDLTALLPAGDAHAVLNRVLRRYTRSTQYLSALAAPGALRHDLAGNPVEPVATAHKVPVRPISEAVPSPVSRPEPFVMSIAVKALKVTVVLDPHVLRPAPAGADVVLDVATEAGMTARARLNPKSYRKALEAIREQGPDNIAVILQGRMVEPGTMVDAGIVAQPKKPKGQP